MVNNFSHSLKKARRFADFAKLKDAQNTTIQSCKSIINIYKLNGLDKERLLEIQSTTNKIKNLLAEIYKKDTVLNLVTIFDINSADDEEDDTIRDIELPRHLFKDYLSLFKYLKQFEEELYGLSRISSDLKTLSLDGKAWNDINSQQSYNDLWIKQKQAKRLCDDLEEKAIELAEKIESEIKISEVHKYHDAFILICYSNKDGKKSNRWVGMLVAQLKTIAKKETWAVLCEKMIANESHDDFTSILEKIRAAILLIGPRFMDLDSPLKKDLLPKILEKDKKDKEKFGLYLHLSHSVSGEIVITFGNDQRKLKELFPLEIIPKPFNSLEEYIVEMDLKNTAEKAAKKCGLIE